MGSLFSTPSVPEPKLPPPPKVDDDSLQNAAQSERLRRARSIGKQQSIFAGELTAPNTLKATLG